MASVVENCSCKRYPYHSLGPLSVTLCGQKKKRGGGLLVNVIEVEIIRVAVHPTQAR